VSELHDGVVAFRPLSSTREEIVLGRVAVGEIGPTHDPRARFPVCFRLDLPDNSSRAWRPARDMGDARRQALQRINDWMEAAGVRPIGGARADN
jgi:hypothetical protein